jgi:RNA polymerase sigma factor (sigma-70 family)
MKIVEEEIPNLIRLQNDKQVIAHLYDEVFPTVQRYIKKNNGIADDAYDVFQDALVYFYKQVVTDAFDSKYTVYGYLFRLAINRWINKLNKDKKMVFRNEMVEQLARDVSYMEEEESNGNDQNKITKFVSSIGEKCVEILTLRIYSNMMFEDIALRMELNSEAAAKMHFKRCREKLVHSIKMNPALADQLR